MEDNSKMASGFRINNLLLIESNFKRINNVQFNEEVKSDLDVNTEVGVQNDNIIKVAETVTLIQKYQDSEQVFFLVKMVAIFECIGETPLKDFEEFGRVNGAAIIFPYIREHITSLSSKARYWSYYSSSCKFHG